ncbi:MAG TPA: hypothetical protein VF471_06055 [Pseudoxanthomonas sp.]
MKEAIDTDARVRGRSFCAAISLVLAGFLTACSMQADLSKGGHERPQKVIGNHDKQSIDDPTKIEKAREFEGQWSYRDDCDRGHYVTLELKRENDHLIGSWSDGTLLRGSQGLLKGRVSKDRLIAEWCSEYEEAGAPALCPHYDWSEDYLVARDDTLVWYQKYGQDYVEYVVLKKGIKSHQPIKACDEDK